MPLSPSLIQPDHFGHRTRYSDSSFYDEVCVTCGATDAGSDLNRTCPNQVSEEEHAAERLNEAKRQLKVMATTHAHMLRDRPPTVDAYWTKQFKDIADLLDLYAEEDQARGDKSVIQLNTPMNVLASFCYDGVVDRTVNLKVQITGDKNGLNIGCLEGYQYATYKSGKLTVEYYHNGILLATHDGCPNVAEGDIISLSPAGAQVFENSGGRLGALKEKVTPTREEGFAKHHEIQRENKATAVKPSPFKRLPGVPGEIVLPGGGLSPLGMDDADAAYFGVDKEVVIKACEMYNAEKARTHILFMPHWTDLPRFRRKEYILRAKAE